MTLTFKLGLTGSIGMGKSTTAAMFAERGIPVWDADAAVHRLYRVGGDAVAAVGSAFADAIVDGGVSRETLKRHIAADPTALVRLESIVHPLVALDRARFLTENTSDIVVLDIPLLFENATESLLDATLLVTAPPAMQRARVLARPNMTEPHFAALLSRQMPDAEKRSRASHIVETLDLASTNAYVTALIAYIRDSNA